MFGGCRFLYDVMLVGFLFEPIRYDVCDVHVGCGGFQHNKSCVVSVCNFVA
jgi:hypothetical protein